MIDRFRLALYICFLITLLDAPSRSQDSSSAKPTGDVIETDESVMNDAPFDLITLSEQAGGEKVRVFPIDFPGRVVPNSPDPNKSITVTLTILPDRKFEVSWKDIAKIDTYESLVLQESKRLLLAKEYAAAFEHLNYLVTKHPETPGLDSLREEFLFNSAIEMFRQQKFPHTLAVLEELRNSFPNSQSKKVLDAISAVSNKLLQSLSDQGDLQSAQELLRRLSQTYQGLPIESLARWNQQFLEQAQTLREDAIRLRDEGRLGEARDAAQQLLYLFPQAPGGAELLRDLVSRYPLIRVGVMQRSTHSDVTSLVDWPARRSGALISKPLFEFRGSGSEGGQYRFSLGSYQTSDDLQELSLTFNRNKPGPSPAEVAQWMLRRASPGTANYRSDLASVFRDVAVDGAERLLLRLNQPHVLPCALLQWQLRDMYGEEAPTQIGNYQIRSQEDLKTSFAWASQQKPEPNQPVEIQEVFYESSQQAVSDLLRGNLDMIDQVYPADAKKLSIRKEIRIEPFALPTVHMLVPRGDHPFLQEVEFRRALLYALNRTAVLEGEILGQPVNQDNRLVSGPFPRGNNENDPLSYAYNTSVEPLAYDPRLAKLLLMMTDKKLTAAAEKKKLPPPALRKLRLAVPNFEAAKIAGEAFVQQWSLVGIPAELVVLDQGISSPEAEQADLLYVAAAVWEPAIDAERLLGAEGIAATSDPYIVQALGQLRSARNWREVRNGLQGIHVLINQHLPLLPLWQVTDSLAYRNTIQGVPKRPMTVYQDMEKWRIKIQ